MDSRRRTAQLSGTPPSGAIRRGRIALIGASIVAVLTTLTAIADDDPFYKQFLKTQQYNKGYQPTRTFIIVSDAERGNQLVAEDDTELRFNMNWLRQYQPDYKVRHNGAAFSYMVRSYLRDGYKALRASHAQTFSAFPDENGTMKVHSFSSEVEYHLNWSGKEMELGIHYAF